jgi:hypothetical protein
MDLQQHKEIILKWVYSCITIEQLDFLSDIIERFVVNRFVNDNRLEVILVVEELNEAMAIRRSNIIELEKQKQDIPTLAYQNK